MSDLKYSKDHEWVREEGDGTATIGVTDFAADQLGDVVYVDLPSVGEEIEAGTEVNEDVVQSPEKVNDDPFGEAWLIKVKVTDIPDDLLSAEEYSELTSK